MAGGAINVGSRIEEHAIINTNATVDHDCLITGHVHVASGCTLFGGVLIEENVLVGTGSSVIQGTPYWPQFAHRGRERGGSRYP